MAERRQFDREAASAAIKRGISCRTAVPTSCARGTDGICLCNSTTKFSAKAGATTVRTIHLVDVLAPVLLPPLPKTIQKQSTTCGC